MTNLGFHEGHRNLVLLFFNYTFGSVLILFCRDTLNRDDAKSAGCAFVPFFVTYHLVLQEFCEATGVCEKNACHPSFRN